MSNHIEIREIVETYVDPYPGKDADEMVLWPCGRCGGDGNVGYTNVFGGVCFKCNGTKGEHITVKTARQRTRSAVNRRNRKERELIAKQEFHNKQVAAAEAKFPVLAGWFQAMSDGNAFLTDLWAKAFDYELSEKQIAAAAKVLQGDKDREAARAAEKAALSPVVEGKGTITGTIVSVKFKDSQFGGAWKMIVLDDRNFKVWGSVPAAIFDQQREEAAEGENPFIEHIKGRKVSFNATIEASEDDKTFGFFKRPTKATLLPAEYPPGGGAPPPPSTPPGRNPRNGTHPDGPHEHQGSHPGRSPDSRHLRQQQGARA